MSAPARFWPRYAAWSLDAALVAAVLAPFLWNRLTREARALERGFAGLLDSVYGLLGRHVEAGGSPLDVAFLFDDPTIRGAIAVFEASLLRAVGLPLLAFAATMLVVQVAGERSRWQGSPGKRALGLRVIAHDGARPGFARSAARQFAGLASWLTLNVGHALAAIAPQHLALHDRLSGTRVVCDSHAPLPAWARGWILLQAGIAMALTVAITGRVASLAQAAIERTLG